MVYAVRVNSLPIVKALLASHARVPLNCREGNLMELASKINPQIVEELKAALLRSSNQLSTTAFRSGSISRSGSPSGPAPEVPFRSGRVFFEVSSLSDQDDEKDVISAPDDFVEAIDLRIGSKFSSVFLRDGEPVTPRSASSSSSSSSSSLSVQISTSTSFDDLSDISDSSSDLPIPDPSEKIKYQLTTLFKETFPDDPALFEKELFKFLVDNMHKGNAKGLSSAASHFAHEHPTSHKHSHKHKHHKKDKEDKKKE